MPVAPSGTPMFEPICSEISLNIQVSKDKPGTFRTQEGIECRMPAIRPASGYHDCQID